MSSLVLFEGQKGQLVDYELAAKLRELNVCEAQIGSSGKAVLTGFRKIGVINYLGKEIEIRPKVAFEQILSLLDPELRSFSNLEADVSLASSENWTEALALFFDLQITRALVRGPMQGYVEKTESSNTIRGRLEFDSLATPAWTLNTQVTITHDDFTVNIAENQLLKTALEVLLATSKLSVKRRNSLRRHLEALEGVSLLEKHLSSMPQPRNPLYSSYSTALRTAQLILGGLGVESQLGQFTSSSFLIDMAQLFEFVIENQFRDLAKLDNLRFNAQYSDSSLDFQGVFKIRPDYMVFQDGMPLAIADAKYKVVSSKSDVPTSDINQMLAYCSRFGLYTGHLIYANSPEFFVDVIGSNVRLFIHELSLGGSRKTIEEKAQAIWKQLVKSGEV
jgi:5-methylcytosine-specific restriction enzyme subunit McrC